MLKPAGCVSSVLVVGAGVAGLSAAIAMARRGIAVDVIDHVACRQPSGAGLTLGAAGLRALQQLGVLDQVMQRGHTHDGIQVCDVQGHPLRFIRSPALPDAQVPGAGGILRSVLQDILWSQAQQLGVALQLGRTVLQLQFGADKVQAELSLGGVREYDLVVGADGLSSALRARYFGHAPPVRFTGQGCWRVVLPRPSGLTNRHFFLGGRYKVGLTPVSDAQMYLFLLEHVPDNPWRDPAAQLDILQQLLKGYGGVLAEVRDQLDGNSQVVYRPLEAHFLGKVWHHERLLLMGDAAHATTPQLAAGAAMGMEDGLVLGEELERQPTWTQALSAFEARRYDRCRLVVESSLRIGELEVAGASPEAQTQVVDAALQALAQPI